MARAGGCSFLALSVLGTATAAFAQEEVDYGHMLSVAEVQTMVTQRMSVDVLLVTMGIDHDLSLERLESSRNEFDRALNGFRDGDATLRLPAAAESELLRPIEEAVQHWGQMDGAITDCLTGVSMTAAHVDLIADSSNSLQDALEDLNDGLRERSRVGESYSVLGVAIETASSALLLSQQMTKEFLLVAYGHQLGLNRNALRETAEDFQNGLQGMLEGDIDRQLLAAPTPDIRTQLLRVEQVWENDYRPLIERAVSEGDLNAGAVARMAQVNRTLLREIELVGSMYRQL